MTEWQRACVYTCLIGRYEVLNEQPVAAQSKIPFLCLTDDAALQSSTWRMIKMDPVFTMDPVRSQRTLKLLPHRFLPDFDISLYIDNSVVLTQPPEEVLDRYLTSFEFALPAHSDRNSLIDEFLEVANIGLDDPVCISEQLDHYTSSDPGALDERPYWTAILARRHRAHNVQRALEIWAAHVLRYSRRDQLSANVAFRQSGLTPNTIEIDNYTSWFHTWPRISSRDVSRRNLPRESLVTFTPGHLRQLHTETTAERAASNLQLANAVAQKQQLLVTIEAMTSSLSWRLTSPLRSMRRRWPNLARWARAIARWAVRHSHATFSANVASSVRCANGRTIYVDSNDARGRSLIQSGGNLNPKSRAMWQALLAEREWTHVIDVGANYGEMLVGVELPRSATAIALEPNPFVVPYLQRTLQDAGLGVKLITKAASARPDKATLYIDRSWSGLSSLAGVQVESAGHAIEVAEVPAITLASLIKEHVADARSVRLLVKIDVESHEVAVLQGLGDIFEQFEEFAAMVEIFHIGDTELEWLLARFGIELFDTETGMLTKIRAATAAEVQRLVASTKFYGQDAVLRRL